MAAATAKMAAVAGSGTAGGWLRTSDDAAPDDAP
jgi:hypothetical protein